MGKVASRALPLLIPAVIIITVLSLYHGMSTMQPGCLFTDENVAFSSPNFGKTKNSERSSMTTGATTLQSTALTETDYDGPYKIYKKWSHPFPCFPAERNWKSPGLQRSPASKGLLYTREMKTGSSTLTGVLLRLAHRKAKTLLPEKSNRPCKVRIDHSSARHMRYAERDKKRSFLLSLLRDPTKRTISQFFHFQVSAAAFQPTDAHFQSYLYRGFNALSNYYIKDLTMEMINDTTLEAMDDYDDLVQRTIDEYDFIGITERMDESLVVLKMLLDLHLGDILYMSAKTQGSFTSHPDADGRPACIYIVPSFLTPGMKEFFASDYWKRYIAADVALYKAANASLTRTIDNLGRTEFEETLAAFRIAKNKAQTRCLDRTIYRCDPAGNYDDMNATCIMWDVGCGHECLSEYAEELQQESYENR